jgi:hypothetical protein
MDGTLAAALLTGHRVRTASLRLLKVRCIVLKYALWTAQGVLAVVFLLLGLMKLTAPLDDLVAQMALPGLFIRFIGFAEVLGAVGLILPGLLRMRTGLTPLAAAGLAFITFAATIIHVARGEGMIALFPLVVGLVSAFVAYGRWRMVPLGRPQRERTLSHAR